MKRRVRVWFDNDRGINSWPYHAETPVADAPGGRLSASGPDEDSALANLKRVFSEWVPVPKEGYPKMVEVDW